jgi:hypothetical protein
MSSLAPRMDSAAEAGLLECPLHIAMDELARVTVTQHVLYLEGECLPRPEILAELNRWVVIHTLIHDQICVASRTTPLEDSEVESALQAMQGDRRTPGRLLQACATCNEARCCPLGSRARSH